MMASEGERERERAQTPKQWDINKSGRGMQTRDYWRTPNKLVHAQKTHINRGRWRENREVFCISRMSKNVKIRNTHRNKQTNEKRKSFLSYSAGVCVFVQAEIPDTLHTLGSSSMPKRASLSTNIFNWMNIYVFIYFTPSSLCIPCILHTFLKINWNNSLRWKKVQQNDCLARNS